MSNLPPYSPGPSGQNPNRSTPIPGGEPMTPAEFLGTVPGSTDAPSVESAGGPQPYGTPQPYGVPQPYGTPQPYGGQPPAKKSRNWGCSMLGAIITLSILSSIGVAVWGMIKAFDTVDKATENVDDVIDGAVDSVDDAINNMNTTTTPTSSQPLWEGSGMAGLAEAFDTAIPGSPTMFTQISIYTDYAFATAQNPQLPDHLDDYAWRDGVVGPPDPASNDPEAPSQVFAVSDVDWAALAAAVAEAPRLLSVEQGEITYVSVLRDMFDDTHPLVARIYVTGPRGSGYVEVDSKGNVLQMF